VTCFAATTTHASNATLLIIDVVGSLPSSVEGWNLLLG
jgi:hypothetical protein